MPYGKDCAMVEVNGKTALVQLRNNWPLIVACVIGTMGYAEMRLELRQLVDAKADEIRQDSRISANSGGIAYLKQLTDVITSDSQEEWGWVKRSVRAHEQEINSFDDRIDFLERLTHEHRNPNFQ